MARYVEKELVAAVSSSTSYAEVLRKLGRMAMGGNYATVKKHIRRLGLDTSHFITTSWNKGKCQPKRSISDYLVYGKVIQSDKLRTRLLLSGTKQHICEHCGGADWFGKPMPLELHHVDGDHLNNKIENLILLCPNCHAFTPNYRGKKNKVVKTNPRQPKTPPRCICGATVSRCGRKCQSCAKAAMTKIVWPSIEQLVQMINNSSFSTVARQLGVSDQAIRKHIKTGGRIRTGTGIIPRGV